MHQPNEHCKSHQITASGFGTVSAGWRGEIFFSPPSSPNLDHNKIAGFQKSVFQGIDITKDLEKRNGWFGLFSKGRIQGPARELLDVLMSFATPHAPKFDEEGEEKITEFLETCHKSEEGGRLYAEFLGIDNALRDHFLPEFLEVEKSLRRDIVDVLTGALVDKAKPNYEQLIERGKALYHQLSSSFQSWDRHGTRELDRLFDECKPIPIGAGDWDKDPQAQEKLARDFSLKYKQKSEAENGTTRA
ncbi:hypothetical protein BDZ45DRAFT_734546 [Acephala macrosclerotiorum]|nr:hypothetical protein BDZ45DRAFT_734546 [Acephala macrosclerotiorum]